MAATDRARTLRRRSTDAERVLWHRLRNRQLAGLKFRRQHVFGPYIIDFICLEHNLVIEVDGGQHAVQPERDARRDAQLAEQGYRVLRFWNHEVLGNIEGVLETVAEAARPK